MTSVLDGDRKSEFYEKRGFGFVKIDAWSILGYFYAGVVSCSKHTLCLKR